MKEQFPTESTEAQDLVRRRLMDANEAFVRAMVAEHPERLVGVVSTPGTELRARTVRPEPNVRIRGWAFE